ncbi:MFS transporter [Actinosynnema pretiosum]
MGAAEIAQNVEGVAVETDLARTVVPGLHGCFSLGICGGGLLGLAATALGVPVLAHLGAVTALVAAATVWVALNLPAATGREEAPAPGSPGTGGLRAALRVWREPRTLAIGAIALGMALAEGTANDWLPLIAVDGYDLSSASGAFLYSFFGASMAVGRFAGGTLLDRFGRTRVMVASAGLAVVGIGLVSLAPNVPLGALGVFLWGLGASLGFPVALSAAGDDPVDSARRVSAVATAGYTAFLVGPPLLGFVGEHVGLRSAILVALVLVALSSLFARSVDKPQPA